jgi:UDP-N-acetylglucosamine--N-acetylmuramyl-(pentapeptide) pyrophosphoryl-undecaprenol N-acetylglucosamine transferase
MVQKPKYTIVICGTHLTPALELINQLKNDPKVSWSIKYIGRKFNSSTDNSPSIESVVIPQNQIDFFSILCGKFDRSFFPNTLRGLPHLFSGLISSIQIISKLKPNIVVSFGGYVSVPVIIASYLKNIPSITHEQTPTLSLATKINSLFVKKVALSFDSQSPSSAKYIVTGNLLRREIFNQKSATFEKLPKNKKILYFTAGNQGSHILSQLLFKLLPSLSEYLVIHTGYQDFEQAKLFSSKYQYYHPFEFIGPSDIGWVLNHADIIISRSGANTSQEIVALQKSSILIPLPVSSQNEQVLNAKWVQSQLPNRTIVLDQKNLTPNMILASINTLISKTSTSVIKHYQPNNKLLTLIYETL